MDWIVGIGFIALGLTVLAAAIEKMSKPRDVCGRNEALRRMLGEEWIAEAKEREARRQQEGWL